MILILVICIFESVAGLPGIPVPVPVPAPVPMPVPIPTGISTCQANGASCYPGAIYGPTIVYDSKCFRVYWTSKGTWNDRYQACADANTVPYFPPPVIMDYGRIVVCANNSFYQSMVNAFAQTDNGTAMGNLWMGAQAPIGTDPTQLSSYVWMTDKTTPGSALTSKSIVIELKASQGASATAPYCLAVDLANPMKFFAMSCSDPGDIAYTICEYGCGPAPAVNCPGGACDMDPTVITVATTVAPPSGPTSAVPTGSLVTTPTMAPTTTSYNITGTEFEFLNSYVSDRIALTTAIKEAIPYLTRQIDPFNQSILGYEANEIIKSCMIQGELVNVSKAFNLTFDATYGNCYTFNNGSDEDRIWSRRAGETEGLDILLLSRQDQFVCSSDSAGFRVVLHDNAEWPFPDSEGDYVRPGTVTRMAIKKVRIIKLPSPYSDCRSNTDGYYYSAGYTIEGCLRSCIQRSIIDECGCADPRFEKPQDAGYCKIQEKKCVDNVYQCIIKGDVDNLGCDCPEPCETIIYQRSISWARFFNKYCIDPSGLLPTMGCPENDTNSMVAQVEIFYQHLSEIRYVEIAQFTWIDLWNTLTNGLGLFLAVDVFTFIEIAVCLCSVIYVLITCQCR